MSYPSRVQCFFIEPTERAKVGLRRYHGSEVKCAGRLGYHSALEYIGECDARIAHRIDKNGLTCAAGAGSIQSGDYHGFLRNGRFEP